MKSLLKLRTELENINCELFKILLKRKQVVKDIQSHKPKNGKFPHYDESREKELFLRIKEDLGKLSKRELLALSLIIEDHAKAGDEDAYPSFFRGDLRDGVNPNLVCSLGSN